MINKDRLTTINKIKSDSISIPEEEITNKKAALIQYFPFLKDAHLFREVKSTEIRSESVYKELFPEGECVCDGRLYALFQWQKYLKYENEK